MKLSSILAFAALLPSTSHAQQKNEQPLNALGQLSYGADVSFPVHHSAVLDKDDPNQPMGDKQTLYNDFIEGCRNHYGKRGGSCDQTEADRIAMSLRQPASMQVRTHCYLYAFGFFFIFDMLYWI